MAQNRTDDPIVELAKSGRSACRTCHEKIPKETPRIGIPFPYTTPSGEIVASYRYYHIDCTPRYKVDEVISFLRKENSNTNDLYETTLNKLESLSGKEGGGEESSVFSSTKPFLQRSKSGRGKCRFCNEKIEKGVIRVAEPSLVELDDGRKFSSNKYFHMNCFINQVEDNEVNLKYLVDRALKDNSINKKEASAIKTEFPTYFDSDMNIHEILSKITTIPIKLSELKTISKENQVDFQLVKATIERGLMKGEFFKPTPDTIQRMN